MGVESVNVSHQSVLPVELIHENLEKIKNFFNYIASSGRLQ